MNEKDILTALIISDKCCNELIPIISLQLFEVGYIRTILGWVMDYYQLYQKSPKSDILKLYRSHCEEYDESTQENILSVIENLNDRFDESKFNCDYEIENAIKYIKSKSISKLAKDLDSYITSGDVDKAETTLINYRKVERNSGESVSVLDDFEQIADAYTKEDSLLFRFSGDYGKLVGDVNREDFIAFLASMKGGKSFMLIDAGVEALKNGLKVVFFSLEMSKEAMIKRFWLSLSGQVREDLDINNYPYFEDRGDGSYIVKHKSIHKTKASLLNIEKKQKALKRLFRGGEIKIFTEPAYSLTVERLETKIDELEQDGYKPDVIIVDYADIMCPSDKKSDYRNQIDGIWKRLRALAQKKRAVVFTASQTTRGAINREAEAEDIAEDIRKLAHITSMISVSRTKVCKKNSIAIFSQLAVREGEPELRKVVATQCLSLGRPVLDSHFKDEVFFDFEEEDDNNEEKIERKRRFK